jgi:hypothetical protein
MALPLLVDFRFQVYFTPLAGVLFTFPSRYLFTIGHRGVLSLGGWSPQIQTGFHVSRPTRDPPGALKFSSTGLSPSMAAFSTAFD